MTSKGSKPRATRKPFRKGAEAWLPHGLEALEFPAPNGFAIDTPGAPLHPAPADRAIAPTRESQDQISLTLAGAQWLKIQWALSEKTIARGRSALGNEACQFTPVLKLYSIDQDDSGPRSKQRLVELEVPDGACEWFLPVPSAEGVWTAEFGFRSRRGRFVSLLHTPAVSLTLRRENRALATGSLGNSPTSPVAGISHPPPLVLKGVLEIQGATDPAASVSIDEHPAEIDSNTGDFQLRVPMENGRSVFAILASRQGKYRRALLAIDVNLTMLEPEPG